MKTIELTNNEFVEISGADAHSFLQGQISCNMDLLTNEISLKGALCNLKGRVIADFLVYKIADSVILQTEIGMGQIIIDVLKKYAVFSKVSISLKSFENQFLGCYGTHCLENLSSLLPIAGIEKNSVFTDGNFLAVSIREQAEQFQLLALNQSAAQALSSWKQKFQTGSNEDWARLEIEAGEIHVSPLMSEEHTPQLLNYDLSGVIDFKKGCYTGQEVVARMFYRSKAKKRLFLLSSSAEISTDDKVIYTEKEQSKLAEILKYSNGNSKEAQANVLLTIISVDAFDNSPAPALENKSDSFLQNLTMPYTE